MGSGGTLSWVRCVSEVAEGALTYDEGVWGLVYEYGVYTVYAVCCGEYAYGVVVVVLLDGDVSGAAGRQGQEEECCGGDV